MADLVVDVFTHEGAGGNPLTVRIDEPLEPREMMAEAEQPPADDLLLAAPDAVHG